MPKWEEELGLYLVACLPRMHEALGLISQYKAEVRMDFFFLVIFFIS